MTAARALVRMAGGLPLVLRIVGARLAARPHWSLASMVGRLADERRRIDELAHGDLIMRASLRLTYEGLDPRDARLFRLLGLLPDGSVPVWTAAALLDEDLRQVESRLERLVDMQLLDAVGPDLDGRLRYGLHSVIRLYAREELEVHERPAARRVALERVLGGWLAMAERMRRELYGEDSMAVRGAARRWHADGSVAMPVDPMAWFESESTHLIAAVDLAAHEGFDELCWELAISLVASRGQIDHRAHAHQVALDAVRRAGNRHGEAALLRSAQQLDELGWGGVAEGG